MKFKEKVKARQFERYWKKQGGRDMFTWVHRYLRLHCELLADNFYQRMYDYMRDKLITYLKSDVNTEKLDDEQLGEIVDLLADIFNKNEAELVNKYKEVVDELYKLWKEEPSVEN